METSSKKVHAHRRGLFCRLLLCRSLGGNLKLKQVTNGYTPFLLYFIMQLYKFLLVLIISCSCYVSNAVGNTKKLLITNQKEFDTFIENLSKYPTEFTDTIELRTDIDVASLNSTTRNFYGYLKGNNHKIKNLKYPLFKFRKFLSLLFLVHKSV